MEARLARAVAVLALVALQTGAAGVPGAPSFHEEELVWEVPPGAGTRVAGEEQGIGGPGASWGLDALDVPAAWAAGVTGAGVRVAVIEPKRFDSDHPLYAAAVGWCADLTGASGACHAEDAREADHATHVTGIVHQVAPDATLYLLSLTGSSASPFTQLKQALDMARKGPDGLAGTGDDAHVAALSLSIVPADLGVPPGSGIALTRTHPLQPPAGLTVVAAAGNHGGPLGTVAYPAADPSTISVSALGSVNTGNRTRVAEYASEGVEDGDDATRTAGEIDFTAPGTGILSSLAGGGYGTKSGTSMAAPHVAGLAALYLSLHPGASPAQVRAALVCGAEDLVAQGRFTTPGHDVSSGFGVPHAPEVLGGPCRTPVAFEEWPGILLRRAQEGEGLG